MLRSARRSTLRAVVVGVATLLVVAILLTALLRERVEVPEHSEHEHAVKIGVSHGAPDAGDHHP